MVLLGIVYFSRTGEQYSVGNITEGNTAIVAGMIADKTGGSLFEIKVADDVYPAGYSELIKFAQKEKRQKARPAITCTVDNFAEYDTVFIGYPNGVRKCLCRYTLFWKAMISPARMLFLSAPMKAAVLAVRMRK